MRINPFLVSILCIHVTVGAQNTDKEFFKVYKRINAQRIFHIDKSDLSTYYLDSLEVVEMQSLLEFYNTYLNQEHKLNGKAGFSFNGNESDINKFFRIGVSGKIDKGVYPSELDFDLNVLTTIQNGVFQENFSDIDVSFDFHPYRPAAESKNDGLWLENYVFVTRFNNNFLGIEQRYETGLGFVFNLYSKNKLTQNGIANNHKLNKIPRYEIYGDDLKRCLEECYLKKSILKITEHESKTIINTRERYARSNIKKYSQLRLALLLGIQYELEKSMATNEINFNSVDTLLTEEFEATNKIRWQVRPSITWQPTDKYKLKIYPFFKMPIGNQYSVVRQGALVDRRYDYFVYLISSFSIQVDDNFQIALNYRMLYDNAPKRKYIQQNDGSYILLVGQKHNSTYGISFAFGF